MYNASPHVMEIIKHYNNIKNKDQIFLINIKIHLNTESKTTTNSG
jgi:hypothetical protein